MWERINKKWIIYTHKIWYRTLNVHGSGSPTCYTISFSSSHVQIWELDHKEGWMPKNWCFWTLKLLPIFSAMESKLDSLHFVLFACLVICTISIFKLDFLKSLITWACNSKIFLFFHHHSCCFYCFKYFPGGSVVNGSTCQCRRPRRCGFYPWVRKIPWSRKWQAIPIFLLR